MPRVEMVDVVTRQHARLFVVELILRVMETEIISDAFSKTEIMTWPDDGAAQERYDDIMQEIVEKTFATAKATMIDAFVAAATEVLARERLPMTTRPSHVEMVPGSRASTRRSSPRTGTRTRSIGR